MEQEGTLEEGAYVSLICAPCCMSLALGDTVRLRQGSLPSPAFLRRCFGWHIEQERLSEERAAVRMQICAPALPFRRDP